MVVFETKSGKLGVHKSKNGPFILCIVTIGKCGVHEKVYYHNESKFGGRLVAVSENRAKMAK